MTDVAEMKMTALAPWYGCSRMSPDRAGRELGKLAWCGVPFCGGCPEIPHIRTRSGLASDLHRHIINLARVIADPHLWPVLASRLDCILFHPDELEAAQKRCREREMDDTGGSLFSIATPASVSSATPDVDWAADYFITAWMGRGGHAGKATEFGQGLAIRYTATGGDSARRFRSAIESIQAWHRAIRPWQFERLDVFDFLDRVKDWDGYGLYIDAPWPDQGIDYKHRFTEEQQRQLADRLSCFETARVVVRYGDHPMIRELYPESKWRWVGETTRNQQNNEVTEVLIVNGGSVVK